MNPKLRNHRRFQRFKALIRGLTALLPLLLILPAPAADAARRTLGRVERVYLVEPGVVMKARIDTGARSTSADAIILEFIPGEAGGRERVRFHLRDHNRENQILEREVIRWTLIKGKGTDQMIRRPVVELALCIGGKRLQGPVNLADRSGFLYPVLVGRDFLVRGRFLVDPAALHTAPPDCPRKQDG
jgi:hypothetical protein